MPLVQQTTVPQLLPQNPHHNHAIFQNHQMSLPPISSILSLVKNDKQQPSAGSAGFAFDSGFQYKNHLGTPLFQMLPDDSRTSSTSYYTEKQRYLSNDELLRRPLSSNSSINSAYSQQQALFSSLNSPLQEQQQQASSLQYRIPEVLHPRPQSSLKLDGGHSLPLPLGMQSRSPSSITSSSTSPTPPLSTTASILKETKNPRKYRCKTCEKLFTTSGHLARHSRIHTGERKHVCPFPSCDARFARHDNCMQHFRTHKNPKVRKRKSGVISK